MAEVNERTIVELDSALLKLIRVRELVPAEAMAAAAAAVVVVVSLGVKIVTY